MPTYDYQCRSCGSVTEVIHSMLEEGPSVCERCGGQLRRVLYPTGIIFKGSGFYRTDSREAASKAASSVKKSGSEAPADGGKGASTTKSADTSSASDASGSKAAGEAPTG